MIILKNFINIFRIPELRRKMFFMLGVLVVYRLGNFIPLIGINLAALAQKMQESGLVRDFFSFFDMISGGNLAGLSIFSLGISPYITASIVMQVLSLSIPTLEALSKEGEYGRRIINQYTRYFALGLSVLQSIGLTLAIEHMGVVIAPGWGFRLLSILLMTVGAMFVMWLSEQISLHGIGNGSSMIIFAGIVARFPGDISRIVIAVQSGAMSLTTVVVISLCIAAIVASIVFLEKGERKIPVQYTRRVVGNRVYGGQGSFIPFRINSAGVMPVIYASAVINVPRTIVTLLSGYIPFLKTVAVALQRDSLLFNVLEFVLIVALYFLCLNIYFNPTELAENMKKSGGFIPGVRPGKKTVEFFTYLLTRIGLVGSIYLGLLAIAPNLVSMMLRLPIQLSIMSGTGLLILVGVALELAAQIEAYLLESRYQGFLVTGRFKGRGVR